MVHFGAKRMPGLGAYVHHARPTVPKIQILSHSSPYPQKRLEDENHDGHTNSHSGEGGEHCRCLGFSGQGGGHTSPPSSSVRKISRSSSMTRLQDSISNRSRSA